MRQVISKRLRSFGYALNGIKILFQTQIHARIHATAVLGVTVVAYWLRCSPSEWAVLVLTCTLVIALEAVNTAIETVVDLVSPDYHHLAGRAKDVAAGAVLLAAVGAIVVAAFIFAPKISEAFRLCTGGG